MPAETASASASGKLHPLLQRLLIRTESPQLDVDAVAPWAQASGHALLVFVEDPVIQRETLDLAVIVPELVRAFAQRFRIGVLLAASARKVAPRFGVRRWPALVLLNDGRYVGAIEGLRDWHNYVAELARLLQAVPGRPPGIGIALADAPGASACH